MNSRIVNLGLSTLVVLFTSAGFAADMGVEVGFRQQSGDSSSTTDSTKSEVGYELGVSAAFELSGPLHFRTGLKYTQRPLTVNAANNVGSAKVSMTYFDVPLTLMYKFEDYAGIFGGLVLAMNLDKSVSGSGTYSSLTVVEPKSMLTPLIFGATFKFAPQMGASVYFESAGDVSRDFKNYRAVGANLIITFE